MPNKLFSEFPPVSTKQWEEVIKKDLKGADYDKKLIWKTEEGIDVRPYYRAEDLQKIKHMECYPGVFPFVRGTKSTNNWLIRQTYSIKDSYSKVNALALDGISKGVESIAFSIDGNKPINEDEMARLLRGINLERYEINFIGCKKATTDILSSFIKHAESTKANPLKVKASFDLDPMRVLMESGNFCCDEFPQTLKKCLDISENWPQIKVIGVNGFTFNSAGSTLVQELGFSLSIGSEYLNILTSLGFSADLIALKMRFTLSVGPNYFLEIAKLRAIKVLWANIVEQYGAQFEYSKKISIHAVTSKWNMTIYDPYVNMLRGTTEAMSAALSGVSAIEVLPFDIIYNDQSEFSNRIAKNVQVILKEESHFDKVTDPASGSYYVESLTDSFIKNGWDLFLKVEDEGGFEKAFKSGSIRNQINQSAERKDKKIANRKEVLLGTNQFPNFKELIDSKVTPEMLSPDFYKVEGCREKITEPLKIYRGAQSFEALRFATENHGKKPKVFMLTFGNLAMCRARAQFSSNFFGVAGFDIIDNNRFSNIDAGVDKAILSGAEIVVACSSDEEYKETPQIREMLPSNTILVIAGDPEFKDELIAKGIDKFINVKSNVLETLKEYQKLLGIKSV